MTERRKKSGVELIPTLTSFEQRGLQKEADESDRFAVGDREARERGLRACFATVYANPLACSLGLAVSVVISSFLCGRVTEVTYQQAKGSWFL